MLNQECSYSHILSAGIFLNDFILGIKIYEKIVFVQRVDSYLCFSTKYYSFEYLKMPVQIILVNTVFWYKHIVATKNVEWFFLSQKIVI